MIMDGQIGEKTDSSALKRYVPDGHVPAKPSSEEKEKSIEICYQVTSKLKTSPSPLTMPDKARTVSSTDSSLQKNPHAFDFRFVAHDDEVRQLLIARTGDEHQDVTLISHPDDLSQANLVTRLSISGDGRQTLRSGKLFEASQPLTLVIDIRKLSSDELPKFNDLLDPDNPCLYDKVSQQKRPLGPHVSLLVLADPGQLAAVGQHGDAPAGGAPGADFWRRINRPDNTWQFDTKTSNEPLMETDEVPPVLAEFPSAESAIDGNTLLIDCHFHNNWRQLLLGGPGVDKQGRIQHTPGRLESLRAGQRVILKGADWEDLAFEQTIRQMLAQQCFESNGKVCQLPDDVQFYQMPVENDELHSLFQSLSYSFDKHDEEGLSPDAPRNPIIINQSNIREWLSPISIAPEGYAVPNSCLLEQVRSGGIVTVTSPLTEALWFRLLGSLQTIRETTGMEPRLQVVNSRQQPEALGLTENDECPLPGSHQQDKKGRNQAAFSTVTYQHHAQVSQWIKDHLEAPLIIQVNDQTSLSELFDEIHIASELKAHFRRRQSQLQEALTAGKPVVMLGLEGNPSLQQLLEPLIVGQPLMVNGQLQAYPQAHVTILWPESANSPSSVFGSMVAAATPCPEIDIWGINVLRHKISRTELPEQALNELYAAFRTVPADLCNPLPEMTEGLLNNLILAARRAQQVDQSPHLLPCHWRKAINSVITHGTRQHPSVRDFMKVACWQLLPDKTPDEDQAASVDPDQLNDIISSTLQLDRTFVEQNLWPLARAFDPAVFNGDLQLSFENPFPQWYEEGVPDSFCAMILAYAPEEKQQAMAYQLEVDPKATEPCQSLAIRPTRQIKRLQDALASGWQLSLPLGQTRSDAIQALASDCFHIARTANSRTEGIERVEQRLSESLKWTSSIDKPLSALARDLYHGETSQKDRENRRLSRLHERFADSPVIFLQGETGTGKSYFSAKMARASGQAKVISLGPSDSEQTLMKRWQWQEHADGDRSMAQQNRALMEWAKIESDKDDEYITLVLDEANLAKTGLLASLNGLWEPEPCIYVNGHPVKVGPKHRVILTGNPDHYAGRQMDPALKEKLPRAYYPRLDRAFLRDRVVEPALLSHLQRHQINDIAHTTTGSVMALWQYYQELLPEHEFTPRDLTDICSWVGWYLDRALPTVAPVTCEQINSLIQQSFRDLLGPEIAEIYQDNLLALEIWFAARYQLDNTLSDRVRTQNLRDIQQPFMQFTEKNRPEFDTSGSAVSELAQQLGQDLSRCQQAYHLDRKHGGRQATLIAGPAGRGKDATLNLMIESVRQQAEQRQELMPEVFYLNACDCSWEKVCEAIQKAKVNGGIVVISEMNLIDSQHLEGELNDILAGDAHPGFHLFATINPPEYSGRKPLSPALKGRFRHLPIRQYIPTELQTIAQKVLPHNEQGKSVAEELTRQHCRLRACLQEKKLPLQPTSLDLQNVAKAINRGGDFTKTRLHQYLNQHYRLYLMAARRTLEQLPGSSAFAMARGKLDTEFCEWFNRTIPGIDRPWLIQRSDHISMDEKNHEIFFNALQTDEETKAEIIDRVAQARWQASGLSLKPYESADILTGAIYRHWQQSWFDREFGQTAINANRVFPLTEEQQQTLKLTANQPYLREADRRISAWNANPVQLWPAFWHQLSDLPSHLADHYVDQARAAKIDEEQAPALAQSTSHEPQPVNEALSTGDDNRPEKYNPEDHEEEALALDRRTSYGQRGKSQTDNHIIFNRPGLPSRMYRWWAKDIFVSAGGDIKWIDINDRHMQGAEVLIPDLLPESDQEVTLTTDQTLATFEWSSDDGRYALPSLTPDDYIVALRITPELPFTLVRDRYTGLHTLTVAEAEANQIIKFAYVVEPREPGIKTSAEEALSEQSKRFDAYCCEGMKTVLEEPFVATKDQSEELKQLLQTVEKARDNRQQIQAIKDYCEQFTGDSVPAYGENLFRFLVTQRQGSCRHRTPVFVALCRYFEIPCRQIVNCDHAFAEYSLDGGQTWEFVDLGGEPVEATEILPDFQPTHWASGCGTESRRIKNLLKGADSAQQQALAEACGISIEELKKALETGGALPVTDDLSQAQIVRKLWEKKDLTGFATGVSLLESLEAEALGPDEQALVGDVRYGPGYTYKPMSEAVKQILSDSDEDQVTDPLRSLYSKMIVQGRASPDQWMKSIVDILAKSDEETPSFIRLADEALKSGWLNPLPDDENPVTMTREHHNLLLTLERIDELKVRAAHCLKMWYRKLLPRGKSSQVWPPVYESFQKQKNNAFFITHCHDGSSSLLEKKILDPSMQIAWTEVPEGIPNIERMLVHDPAFEQLKSGKVNRRPVIILGKPNWGDGDMCEKYEALFQKVSNSPRMKQFFEDGRINNFFATDTQYSLKDKCREAVEQAFCHYLCDLTLSEGGHLTYCWGNALINGSHDPGSCYGSRDPSSAKELYAMMDRIGSSFDFQCFVKVDYLKQVQNASTALVLKPHELTKIAKEFLHSVNLNSLCDAVMDQVVAGS